MTPPPIILLVDDTKAHRSLFIRALKKAGIETTVIEAESLSSAKEIIQKQPEQPLFSLAVVDLNLGDGRGTELICEIREMAVYQDTPVVVFSTSPMDSDRESSIQAGANAYEIKEGDPIKFREQVARCVRAWLGSF